MSENKIIQSLQKTSIFSSWQPENNPYWRDEKYSSTNKMIEEIKYFI